MSADTLAQIAQVRDFSRLNNQHAPLLVALWKPFYELGVGPAWVLTLQVATFLSGCYLVLRSVFAQLPAAILTSGIALWPAVYGMLGYLSRDTWFAALLVLTFGLIVRATQRDGRERTLWLGFALAAASLTLAARQNAAPAVVLALAVLVALHVPRRRVLFGLAGGVAATVMLIAAQWLIAQALAVEDVAPEQYVYVYDLGAMSVRDNANHFPAEVLPDRSAQVLQTRWNADSVVSLVWAADAPIKPTPLSRERLDALRDAWGKEVVGEPLEYLGVRWNLLMRNLGVSASPQSIYHPAIDENTWGFALTFPEANDAARNYVETFAVGAERLDGGVLHRVWVYLLIALLASFILLRHHRTSLTLVAVSALGFAALSHQAGLFLGTPQNGYRLEFIVPVIALLVLAVAVRLRLQTQRTAETG